MIQKRSYLTKVISVGLMTLVLLSVLLFVGRKICDVVFLSIAYRDGGIRLRPSGLGAEWEAPEEVIRAKEPNMLASFFDVMISPVVVLFNDLGLVQDYYDYSYVNWINRFRPLRVSFVPSNICYFSGREFIYFDEGLGLLVGGEIISVRSDDRQERRWEKEIKSYAGPNGIASAPAADLGRFSGSMLYSGIRHSTNFIVFDRGLRRFFGIDFLERTVRSGPVLGEESKREPVQIGVLHKNEDALSPWYRGPQKRVYFEREYFKRQYQAGDEIVTYWESSDGRIYDDKSMSGIGYSAYLPYTLGPPISQFEPGQTIDPNEEDRITRLEPRWQSVNNDMREVIGMLKPFFLVLDASGRIDKVDGETLEYIGGAGNLPLWEDFNLGYNRADELLSYRVFPLMADNEYQGIFVAGLSRDGRKLNLTSYGKNGSYENRDSVFFRQGYVAGGGVLFACKYILEGLHPPILQIASFFTVDTFEAGAGHRGMFLLDGSIMTEARGGEEAYIGLYLLLGLVIIMPFLLIYGILALQVCRHGAKNGIDRGVMKWWAAGIMTFGLAGYITYWLTRERIKLVTCRNCGRGRRTDRELCHRCGSGWAVAEHTRPAWRVFDGAGLEE